VGADPELSHFCCSCRFSSEPAFGTQNDKNPEAYLHSYGSPQNRHAGQSRVGNTQRAPKCAGSRRHSYLTGMCIDRRRATTFGASHAKWSAEKSTFLRTTRVPKHCNLLISASCRPIHHWSYTNGICNIFHNVIKCIKKNINSNWSSNQSVVAASLLRRMSNGLGPLDAKSDWQSLRAMPVGLTIACWPLASRFRLSRVADTRAPLVQRAETEPAACFTGTPFRSRCGRSDPSLPPSARRSWRHRANPVL
jgi:hypothetical protein